MTIFKSLRFALIVTLALIAAIFLIGALVNAVIQIFGNGPSVLIGMVATIVFVGAFGAHITMPKRD